MNKDEIKKDLINILKNQCDNAPFDYCYGCDCNECRARVLTNAGYCRVADDEVVIKKAEYDTLLKDYALTYDNAYQWGLKVGEEKTAIEILQELYDEAMRNTNEVVELTAFEIKQLAEKYGIELED